MKMNKSQAAMEAVEKGLAQNPRDPKIMAAKAMILKDQPGKAQQALETINQAIAQQPKNKHFHHLQGEIYVKLGNPAKAMACFREACSLGSQKACQRLEKMSDKIIKRRQLNELPQRRLERGDVRMPHRRPLP